MQLNSKMGANTELLSSNAAVRGSLSARLADAFSYLPDDDSDLPRLHLLLSIGVGAVLLFVTACVFNAHWYEVAPLAPLPLRLFDVAYALAALLAISRVSIRHWRWWAIAFCLGLLVSFFMSAMAVGDEEPLFVALLVLTVTTAVILPWGFSWQTGFAGVALMTTTAAWFSGLVPQAYISHLLVLSITIAYSVTLALLKDFSLRQRILIAESHEREAALRAESGHRADAEALARRREAILRKVLETSLDVIIITRLPDLNYIYVNDQFNASGYTFEEARGKTPFDLKIFADTRQSDQMMATLYEQGHLSDFELDIRYKSGMIVPYLVSAVMAEIDGEQCMVSMSRDITLRKQLERDLIVAREDALAASRAKSEFLSSMSHEIRTPMNAVLGMADLLLDTTLSGEQRRYVDVMVANGNSLLELINSILDLARIESGRMQIEHTEFDLTDLIDKTISTFGVQAHSKGLELIARIAPGVPTHLIGDPLRVRQILINFLGNAIKFTEQGEILLEVNPAAGSTDPAELCFSVADSGIGIAPGKLKTIFSNFTQADSSTTRKYGGTGLGLAIAERLAKLMGGTIAVESEVHHGSKFSVAVRFGLATRVISPTAHVVLNLDSYRVLVVDDNHINRLIAREMISNCGAEVSEAASGEEALIAIRQASDQGKPFRIILLDMRMPGMDGLEVAQHIREEHLPTEPLILMLSSDDLKPQVARLKELCLDAYLIKPITRKELFDAIGRVIQGANRNSVDALPERGALSLPARETVPALPLDQPKILIADDSADNRLLIGAYLRREPYQLEFADDGKIAIEKFKSNQYTMVFMDVQMPEVDGLAATRIIRQWEKDNHRVATPIIALTASALDEDVQRTRAAGCDLHLSKPVKKSVLLDTIGKVLLQLAESRAAREQAALIPSAS